MRPILTANQKLDGLKYRQFASIAEYVKFYRKIRDTEQNWVNMFVPAPDGRSLLSKVGVWDPFEDKDLTRILASPEFSDSGFYIAPVYKTRDRIAATALRNYRFERGDEYITRYRDDMLAGDFFPLLVFDAKRDFFPSGEHRLLAGTHYDAHYCVVFPDLTDEQLVILYERTNRHHGNGYTSDERANLFYDIKLLPDVDPIEALRRAGLSTRMTNGREKQTGTLKQLTNIYTLAGELVRKYPDVRDTGGGRRRPMSTIGIICQYLGGQPALTELDEDEWRRAFAIGTAVYTGQASRRRDRKKEQTPRERLRLYEDAKRKIDAEKALRAAGVTNEKVDDRALVDIAKSIVAFRRSGLTQIKAVLTQEDQELVGRAAFLLDAVFGFDEGDQ